MSSNITENLVEAIAKRRLDEQLKYLTDHEDKNRVPAEAFRTWDELTPVARFERKQWVLQELNLIIPELVAAGWTAPVEVQP